MLRAGRDLFASSFLDFISSPSFFLPLLPGSRFVHMPLRFILFFFLPGWVNVFSDLDTRLLPILLYVFSL